VFSTHREPWFGVELGGAGMALAGAESVKCLICRVNRHLHGAKQINMTLSFFLQASCMAYHHSSYLIKNY